MTPPRNLQTAWVRLFIGGLHRAGVEAIVLSPGARSAPIVFAASRIERLRIHLVRDERAASFFALGLARASGRAVALACTSGTAGGHYLPALMEARASGVPLVVLTADRPPELHGIAAPQTVDQTALFGEHAVGGVDLGMADAHPAALRGLTRIAAQVVHQAETRGGAVHVNVRARKPLEPIEDITDEGRALSEYVDRALDGRGPRVFAPRPSADPAGVTALAEAFERAERPLVVVGPRSPNSAGVDEAFAEAVHDFASKSGAPLIAEASSQLRLRAAPNGVLRVDGYDRLLNLPDARAALAPDMILQVGAPPTSAALLRAFGAWPAARWLVAAGGWPDVDNRAEGVVLGPPEEVLAALVDRVGEVESSYPGLWRRADELAWSVERESDWGEAAAVGAAVRATPNGAAVMLGNSLPIRHVEAHVRASREEPLPVVVQRGVNGIDGFVAGALGWATGRARGVTVLLGDVTFLHDATSLELARSLEHPVVFVVLDNRGGRIFERLPLHGFGDEAMRPFVTTPDVELGAVAEAYGAKLTEVQSAEEVERAVIEAHRDGGVSVVRARVTPHGAREQHEALVTALSAEWSTEEMT